MTFRFWRWLIGSKTSDPPPVFDPDQDEFVLQMRQKRDESRHEADKAESDLRRLRGTGNIQEDVARGAWPPLRRNRGEP